MSPYNTQQRCNKSNTETFSLSCVYKAEVIFAHCCLDHKEELNFNFSETNFYESQVGSEIHFSFLKVNHEAFGSDYKQLAHVQIIV